MKATYIRQYGHDLNGPWRGRVTRFWDLSVVSPEETFIPWQIAHIPATFIVAADETVTINNIKGADTITFFIGDVSITIETGKHQGVETSVHYDYYYVYVNRTCVYIAETFEALAAHVRTIVRTLRAAGIE